MAREQREDRRELVGAGGLHGHAGDAKPAWPAEQVDRERPQPAEVAVDRQPGPAAGEDLAGRGVVLDDRRHVERHAVGVVELAQLPVAARQPQRLADRGIDAQPADVAEPRGSPFRYIARRARGHAADPRVVRAVAADDHLLPLALHGDGAEEARLAVERHRDLARHGVLAHQPAQLGVVGFRRQIDPDRGRHRAANYSGPPPPPSARSAPARAFDRPATISGFDRGRGRSGTQTCDSRSFIPASAASRASATSAVGRWSRCPRP
ncbi:MAG: hypothetical protein IPK07_33985 [Deltaproteobacteria bacterium]|nr:hypothetical protein [Deltaproteobacteria bacterium]